MNKIKHWYFFGTTVFLFLLLFLINQSAFFRAISLLYEIILRVIPVLLTVFVLMVLTNYFVDQKSLLKHFTSKGLKKWLFASIGGVLSSGPIYMWYPLLADLKEKGMDYGLIACFLYNRAIKIALIPTAIFYFGWQYVFVLTITMFFASILQGIIIKNLVHQ